MDSPNQIIKPKPQQNQNRSKIDSHKTKVNPSIIYTICNFDVQKVPTLFNYRFHGKQKKINKGISTAHETSPSVIPVNHMH